MSENQKKKILVIEDTDTVRNNIATILELEGYTVVQAANGEEGIEKAFTERPDLIICDILMPKKDGLEVLETIRKTEELKTIPFVFLTARAERSDIRSGMSKGADDYLTKPFEVDELLTTVQRQLEKSASIQQDITQKIEELKTSLSYSLPHEFRTALNGIIGYAEILLQSTSSGETLSQNELLEIGTTIKQSALRLYRISENFLLYTQLRFIMQDSEEQARLRRNRTNEPAEVLEETALSIASQYNRTNDLLLQIEKELPIAISYQNWQKILYELIDNAFKFSDAGTFVEIFATVENDLYTVYIRDKGIGMEEEQIKNLASYRQFNRNIYEQQGVGLGLAIAQLLVAIHNGTLTITSYAGSGTTVIIQIPVAES